MIKMTLRCEIKSIKKGKKISAKESPYYSGEYSFEAEIKCHLIGKNKKEIIDNLKTTIIQVS